MAWEDEHDWYDQESNESGISFIDATIIKQTEKAYLIEFKNKDTAWVPKSVIKVSANSLYLYDWFFENLTLLKPIVAKETELDIFNKKELEELDEPRMTYNEWLEEYKKRTNEIEHNNKPLFQESLNEIEPDIFKIGE